MNRIRLLSSTTIALAVAGLGAPAFAQTDPVATNPTAVTTSPAPVIPRSPDADLLASEMRFLTQNPRDLRALLSAAQISTRIGDTSAALAFYARAEAIEPDNPRIMAGRAQVLVKLERPGEALAMFQSAEQRGLPMNDYLADRGLAYDLLGAPHLAQRDYRASLQRGYDDETVRRLGLSLGITGKYDEAMRVLDPLLRRSDRAAWRARAFILAMQGDAEGAERIAQSMMPGNMGQGLTPFFRRLPGLSPSDKAFAVHFGALTPTPARLADAQLAPQFQPYVPERTPPPQPIQVAAVVPVPLPTAPPTGKRQSRRDRERPTQLAAVTSIATRPPVPQPEANPLPPPPQYIAPTVQPIPAAPIVVLPTPTPAPVRLASANTDLPTMRRIPGQRAAPRRPDEDGGLANIMGSIEVPADERAAFDVPSEDRVVLAPEPARVAPPTSRPATPPAAKPAAATPKPAAATPKPAATPPRPAPKKAEPKPPPEPKRFWVQVGIGQNEKLLPQTWRKLVKDNPAVFRGRTPWWTPLRATNRLLTGPFKTAAEAQAFVNTARKAGVESVAFTSDAGQKVTKLEVK